MSDFPFQFAIKSNMNVAFNIWQQYCNSTWKIKLNINSIGLKSNQTFQWHLSSPCDIQQPLYLSSSRGCAFVLILQLFLMLLYLISKLIKPFSSVKALEQFHSQHVYIFKCLNIFLSNTVHQLLFLCQKISGDLPKCPCRKYFSLQTSS